MSRGHRGINRKAWERIRLLALDASGWRCCQCGKAGRLEVDHRTPLAHGGAALELDNLQVLCVRCHILKTSGENSKPGPERIAWKDYLKKVL